MLDGRNTAVAVATAKDVHTPVNKNAPNAMKTVLGIELGRVRMFEKVGDPYCVTQNQCGI